jgi:hypothetical protein
MKPVAWAYYEDEQIVGLYDLPCVDADPLVKQSDAQAEIERAVRVALVYIVCPDDLSPQNLYHPELAPLVADVLARLKERT